MPYSDAPSRSGRSAEDIAAARLVRRVIAQWPLIVACALVAAIAGYLASNARTEQFEATTQIQLNEVDLPSVFLGQNLQQQGQDAEAKAATNAELVQIPRVRERASRALGGRISAKDIGAGLTVTPKTGTTLVDIKVTNEDPRFAAQIADAVRDAFIATRRETAARQFTDAERDLAAQLADLPAAQRSSDAADVIRDRLAQVRTLRTVSNGGIETVQTARIPSEPVSPRPKRDSILALLAGGLLGLGAALLRARLDDRIREPEELAEVWDLPVIGLVPQSEELSTPGAHLPDGSSLEAFALARTNLRYLHVGGDVKTVVVSSAIPAEGKSTVAWNLALAAAMAGSKVLLVEGDLRQPVLATRLGLTASKGFSELLAGLASIDDVTESVTLSDGTAIEGSIDVIPAGMTPPSPIALLERPATPQLLAELREGYDIVFIDSPPATVVADAMVLMDAADGAVVVARLGRTTRGAAERLREVLESHDTPVLGQVINGGDGGGAYGYGYAYTGGTRTSAPATA